MKNLIDKLKPYLKPKDIDENNKDPKDIKIEKNNQEVELRIKQNLFDGMIKKFQHSVERFQEIYNEIKSVRETKIVRGAEIALGQDLDEQERKQVIEDPQMVVQIYENKLKQKAHLKLISAVRDLEERHQDIKRLEKSVLELHKMVVELNLLFQYQGEMIDNIVINIKNAKDYIDKANVEIHKGNKCMECKRKIKCIIMIIVIAILLIILIPIIVKFTK